MSKRKRNKKVVKAEVTTNKVEQPDFEVVRYYKTEEDEMNEKKGFMRFIDRYLEDLYVKALEFYKECNDIKAVRALEAQGSLCYDARLQNV